MKKLVSGYAKIAVFSIFLVSTISIGSSQSTFTEGFEAENVNVQWNESHVTFSNSYIDKDIKLIDFYVPEELQDDLAYVTPCDPNLMVCQGEYADEIYGNDKLFHILNDPNSGSDRFYTEVDYLFAQDQYDDDNDIPDGFNNRRINQEVSYGYRSENDGDKPIFYGQNENISINVKAYNENLVIKYKYGNSSQTFTDVFKEDEPPLAPFNSRASSYNADQIINGFYDNRFDEAKEISVIVANPDEYSFNSFSSSVQSELVTGNYYDEVERRIDSNGLNDTLKISDPANYEFKVYNITVPDDKVVDFKASFNTGSENVEPDFYMYVLGSVAGTKTYSDSGSSSSNVIDSFEDQSISGSGYDWQIRGDPNYDIASNTVYDGVYSFEWDASVTTQEFLVSTLDVTSNHQEPISYWANSPEASEEYRKWETIIYTDVYRMFWVSDQSDFRADVQTIGGNGCASNINTAESPANGKWYKMEVDINANSIDFNLYDTGGLLETITVTDSQCPDIDQITEIRNFTISDANFGNDKTFIDYVNTNYVESNNPPTIDGINTNPSEWQLGQSTDLGFNATDPDGDSITATYEFEKNGSIIVSETSLSSNSISDFGLNDAFTPDQGNGNYQLNLNVSDSNGLWEFVEINQFIEVIDPVFNSTSVNPDPPLFDQQISYNAEVYDEDGNVVETRLTVTEGGTTVINNVSRSGVTPEWNNLFTLDQTGVWLNATFTVVDDDGNTNTETINRKIEDLDTSITNIYPENQTYTSTDQFIRYKILDDNDNVDETWFSTIRLNGQFLRSGNDAEGVEYQTSNFDFGSYSDNPEANYYWTLNTSESKGETQSIDLIRHFTISLDNPNVNIVTPETKTYNSSTINVSFTASDPSSSVVKTEYRLNGGSWNEVNGNFTLSNLIGTYTIDVRATDEVGNTATDSVTFEMNPDTFELISPENNTVFDSGDVINYQIRVASDQGTVILYANGQQITSFDHTGGLQNYSTSRNTQNIGKVEWFAELFNETTSQTTTETYVSNIVDVDFDFESGLLDFIDGANIENEEGWIEEGTETEDFDTDQGNEEQYRTASASSVWGTISGSYSLSLQNPGNAKRTSATVNLPNKSQRDLEAEFRFPSSDSSIGDSVSFAPYYRDSNGDIQELFEVTFSDGDVSYKEEPGDSSTLTETDYYGLDETVRLDFDTDYENDQVIVEDADVSEIDGNNLAVIDLTEDLEYYNGMSIRQYGASIDGLYNVVLVDEIQFERVNKSYTEETTTSTVSNQSVARSDNFTYTVNKVPGLINTTVTHPEPFEVFKSDSSLNVPINGEYEAGAQATYFVQVRDYKNFNWVNTYNETKGIGNGKIRNGVNLDEGNSITIEINNDEHTFELVDLSNDNQNADIRVDGSLSTYQEDDIIYLSNTAVRFTDFINGNTVFISIASNDLSLGYHEARIKAVTNDGAEYFSNETQFEVGDMPNFLFTQPTRNIVPNNEYDIEVYPGFSTPFNTYIEYVNVSVTNGSKRITKNLYDDQVTGFEGNYLLPRNAHKFGYQSFKFSSLECIEKDFFNCNFKANMSAMYNGTGQKIYSNVQDLNYEVVSSGDTGTGSDGEPGDYFEGNGSVDSDNDGTDETNVNYYYNVYRPNKNQIFEFEDGKGTIGFEFLYGATGNFTNFNKAFIIENSNGSTVYFEEYNASKVMYNFSVSGSDLNDGAFEDDTYTYKPALIDQRDNSVDFIGTERSFIYRINIVPDETPEGLLNQIRFYVEEYKEGVAREWDALNVFWVGIFTSAIILTILYISGLYLTFKLLGTPLKIMAHIWALAGLMMLIYFYVTPPMVAIFAGMYVGLRLILFVASSLQGERRS